MEHDFTIELTQQADYRFETRYDAPGMPAIITDERPPLGVDAGPNPSRLLTTAVANCLLANLLFAVRKFVELIVPAMVRRRGRWAARAAAPPQARSPAVTRSRARSGSPRAGSSASRPAPAHAGL
jgi:hypothetical protein